MTVYYGDQILEGILCLLDSLPGSVKVSGKRFSYKLSAAGKTQIGTPRYWLSINGVKVGDVYEWPPENVDIAKWGGTPYLIGNDPYLQTTLNALDLEDLVKDMISNIKKAGKVPFQKIAA